MSQPQPHPVRPNYTRQNVEATVLRLAHETFELEEFDLETNLAEAGADSMLYYGLEAKVEEAFNIEFSVSEYQQISTLQDLANVACRLLDIA